MTDIIVTTPKSQMRAAAEEAAKANGCGFYFRVLSSIPKKLEVGNLIWYAEDGYVRGFGIISSIHIPVFTKVVTVRCSTTGTTFTGKCIIRYPTSSWHWTSPVPMKGFQGWRYYHYRPSILGRWNTCKPEVKE